MRHYPPRITNGNTSWNGRRDRAAQARFRKAVLRRDAFTCQHCGHHDPTGEAFDAHHVQPGYTAECGITLCRGTCHKHYDPYAR